MTRRRLLVQLTLAAAVVAGLAGCSDGGSEKAFCEKVGAVPEFVSVFSTVDLSSATAATQLDAAVAPLRDLAGAAPDEIRSAVGKLADVAEKLASTLSDPDDPRPAAQRLEDLANDLDGVEDASSQVVAYAQSHCGIQLDPTP